MDKELKQLIYGGILDDDIIALLGNLEDLGDDVDIEEEGEGSTAQAAKVKQKVKKQRAELLDKGKGSPGKTGKEEGKSEDEDNDSSSSDDDNEIKSDIQLDGEDESENHTSPKARGAAANEDTMMNQRSSRVQFTSEHQASSSSKNYNGIDLPILLQTRNEIIYRLTDLYLPKFKNQYAKMVEYNKEKMQTQNDDQNQSIRAKKRIAKDELKKAKLKLNYQIKYCNPTPLLEDINYLYKEGITSRHLEMRGKYSNAAHISKIIPTKRPISLSSQMVIDEQKMIQLQNKQQQLLGEGAGSHEGGIKSYLLENTFSIEQESQINEWDKKIKQSLELKDPTAIYSKNLEKQYETVCAKIIQQEISIVDLGLEEKNILKEYLKKTSQELVNSKYPKLQMNNVEKQMFQFLKFLNTEDFSHKGQKSAFQSDDAVFLDELMGGAGGAGHAFIGSHTTTSDDKLYTAPDQNSFGQVNTASFPNTNNYEITDAQLQEGETDQKYKIMSLNSNQPIKRRKYWGEPLDCKSIQQQNLDYYQFKKYQNKAFGLRGNQDEKLFKVERYVDPKSRHSHSGRGHKNTDQQQQHNTDKSGFENISMKDIKDYEYLRKQEALFYDDVDNYKININSVMRNVQKQLGLITDEEFYAQEALADQMETMSATGSNALSVNSYGGKGSVFGTNFVSKGDKQRENYLFLEKKKEKVCIELVDNFDIHFERRKKDMHDNLLKKISQHEKANQQTSSTQQTVAYASGTHGYLLDEEEKSAGDAGNRDKIKSLVSMNKIRDDSEWGMNDSKYNLNADEEMAVDEANQNQKQNMHEGMAEDNMRLRVTKSRANELNHAKCILKLTYTKFDWSEKALLNFHRPNIQEIFDQLFYGAENDLDEKKKIRAQAALPKSSTQIIIGGARQIQVKEVVEQNNYDQQQLPQSIPYVNLQMNPISNDMIEKRVKTAGIINAHEYFKDRMKLSLKDGKFCIFEHIDQNPLFINNFGMASKLKRYVYADKYLQPSAFLKRQENVGTRHMGQHGAQILKKKGEKIPLLGQIDTKPYKGLTVMENNMYYCPVFYHKPQMNDFLCVVHKDKKGNSSIIVRDLQDLYVMGQEEPKIEVYNPQSRQYQHFIKRRTQAYVIRFLQENNNYISFVELNRFFPYINDQILKKIMKEIGVEVDRNQYCSLSQEYNDEQFRSLITPENVCQYESAQFGEQMLKKVGVQDITNADKISYATNKFCSEEPDPKKQLIARLIEEEVLSTPWNLSQNFIHNRQTRGMMMLEGIGDPSNGNGGYSYLKLPLKISQDSLNKAKINRMYLNPAIQNPKAVTGTDADLRKLSKKEIKNKLINLGFKEEQIQAFTRWEMVALLRDKSSQAVSLGMEGDMKKFARGVRFTSKKQREMYQKQVNDIFKKQMNYLAKENPDFISDLSDSDTRDNQRQRKLNDLQQMNNNYQKNIVEMKEDVDITNIKQIPNYQILLMASQPQSAMAPNNPNGLGISGTSQQTSGLNIGGNSGQVNTGIDLATGNIDLQAAAEALRQRLQEGGMTLSCKILRKKIKPVDSGNAAKSSSLAEENKENSKFERIIFCSDPRQIKGFSKRKLKHDVKTKRTKKTSLKEKMQITKPMLADDLKENRRRGSETSSVVRQTFGNPPSSGSSKLKIQIGGSGMDKLDNRSLDSRRVSSSNRGSSQIAINLGAGGGGSSSNGGGGGNNRNRNRVKIRNLKFSEQLSSMSQQRPFDQMSGIDSPSRLTDYQLQNQQQQQQYNTNQQVTMQSQADMQSQQDCSQYGGEQTNNTNISVPQAKITIKFDNFGNNNSGGQQQENYESGAAGGSSRSHHQQQQQPYKVKRTLGGQHQLDSRKKVLKAKKTPNKFANTAYNDDDYESYKPKTLHTNRRRMISVEHILNEIFGNVIDSCICFDKTKLFHYPVKKKDAPNYYEFIKDPIDLTSIKNKAKRSEYSSREQFLGDLALLRSNAEIFNGAMSLIAQLARDIEKHAAEKLSEVSNDVTNVESLIEEKQGDGASTSQFV